MSHWLAALLVLRLAAGPWLFADALYVHAGQSQAHWAASSGFRQAAFFWAIFVFAVASAWFGFSRLVQRGSVIAVAGSIAAFLTGAAVFGYVWYVAVFFLHAVVFGGSI